MAGTNVPFEAVYEVTVDGKPRLETIISLSRQDDEWLLQSTSSGTRGLARFLNAKSNESSTGQWQELGFIPSEFRHHSKIAGRKDQWTASFDWDANTVTTLHEDGESVMPVSAGTSDPMSLTLALRAQLEKGLKEFSLEVVDEDEIDHHLYRAADIENLQTPLGCFEVVPLQRVRQNSKRYSSGWYATSLGYFPVQLMHGKKGSKKYQMRITRLVLDGKEMTGQADCPS